MVSFLHPFRDVHRRELTRQSFPAAWEQIIERNVPFCWCLHLDERRQLEDLIKVFIAEKHFEGCGGLEITDEIKVTVAAQACLLLLNLHHNYYERLVSILVYPEGFQHTQEQRGVAGTVDVVEQPVLGLSSSAGVVVLSWPDVVSGARQPHDGVNVVFHEFAHQLDQLDGVTDGAPDLESPAVYREWARVLGAEFQRLQAEVEADTPSLISSYGATQPAEFFAVVTELFFERPLDLQREHPDLYDEFKNYFHQDPAARQRKNSSGDGG